MIKKLYKWDDFIEESTETISEIIYIYSEEFKKRLNEIDSPISKFLLQSEDNESIKDNISYIDITIDKIDMVSFIQLNRVLRDYKSDLEYYKNNLENFIRLTRYKNHQVWKNSRRTQMTIGRFVNRVYQKSGKNPNPKELESFVNDWKTIGEISRSGFDMMELVTGEKIRHWYNSENYSSGRGQLGASCMRYEECQPYLDIYVENPEVCKLLIKKSSDPTKIVGRALIWTLTDGQIYMDRVYTNNDWEINYFETYYRKIGGKLFSWQDVSSKSIQLKRCSHEYYPYMDTFKYLDTNNCKLHAEEVSKNGVYILEDTDGGFIEVDLVWSEIYGEWINSDAAVSLYNFEWDSGQVIYSRDAVYINSRRYYVPRDESVLCEIKGIQIVAKDSVKIIINSSGEYDFIEGDCPTLTEIKFGDKMVKTSLIVIKRSIGGDWIFRDVAETNGEVVEWDKFYKRVLGYNGFDLQKKWKKFGGGLSHMNYLVDDRNVVDFVKLFTIIITRLRVANNRETYIQFKGDLEQLLSLGRYNDNNLKYLVSNSPYQHMTPQLRLVVILSDYLFGDDLDMIQTFRWAVRESGINIGMVI
jgi:hypothetical protein